MKDKWLYHGLSNNKTVDFAIIDLSKIVVKLGDNNVLTGYNTSTINIEATYSDGDYTFSGSQTNSSDDVTIKVEYSLTTEYTYPSNSINSKYLHFKPSPSSLLNFLNAFMILHLYSSYF